MSVTLAQLEARLAQLEAQVLAMGQGSPKLFYSRQEAAHALALSVDTVDEMIRDGSLKAERNGRRVLVEAASVERWAALKRREQARREAEMAAKVQQGKRAYRRQKGAG